MILSSTGEFDNTSEIAVGRKSMCYYTQIPATAIGKLEYCLFKAVPLTNFD
jgi:hypothetical protein